MDAWAGWAAKELPTRRAAADRARQRALRANDEASWQHAEIVEQGYGQLAEMLEAGDAYFARIEGTMEDPGGEMFQVDVRVHKYGRSEAFPVNGQEMLDISHLATLADLVRNPAQQDLYVTVRDVDALRWPDLRGGGRIRVHQATVQDIELEGGRVTRMAPRYGAIFEDRVRRRLQLSAKPALDVLADVLDREQNLIINDRDPAKLLMILDGPAGTGKTVVAAHRVAVVVPPGSPGLYLTPTAMLRDYVKPALPRLGLERLRARALSLADLAATIWPELPWAKDLVEVPPEPPGSAEQWEKAFRAGIRDDGRRDWNRVYREAARTMKKVVADRLDLTDVVPLLWLAAIAGRPLVGARPTWVIVDEAQAIPLMAYRALRKLVQPTVPFVLAGDLMQQGSSSELGGWDAIRTALDLKSRQSIRMWLHQNYRVPPRIHQAAERLRLAVSPDSPPSESVPWHPHAGSIDADILSSEDAQWQAASDHLQAWQQEGISSLVVLVPDAAHLPRAADRLTALGIGFQPLNGGEPYRGGAALATLDAVRGLEFDGVMLVNMQTACYPHTDFGARKLYTSLTRARRAVHLLARDDPRDPPTPWIDLVATLRVR